MSKRHALGFAAIALLAGCDEMIEQPKQLPYRPAGTLAREALRPPEGTVAFDAVREAPKPALSRALIQRGQQRFDIYCAPCHSRLGDGSGMIVQRGFPPPPSFFEPRLLDAPDQHFFDVITEGFGAMYSYAYRVAPADRWAIAAYIRALQASRKATVASVPADQRWRLQ